MRTILWCLILLLVFGAPAAARVGDPVAGFMGGPLVHQLLLTPRTPASLSGQLAGSTLHRFVSDDGTIIVDLVVRGGTIDQQVMYLPMDMRRGYQVSFFLQDAVGSVVGTQKGMIAFRAAIINKKETYLPFAVYTMRFTPLDATRLRVLVGR